MKKIMFGSAAATPALPRWLIRARGEFMRKLLAVSALAVAGSAGAYAADLPVQQAYRSPAVVATVYNWTGIYVGGNAG
jgi:hypothetical protein